MACAVLALAAAAGQVVDPPPLDRPVRPLVVATPLTPADVPVLVPQLLAPARVLYGVEAERNPPIIAMRRGFVTIAGTVRQVLDALGLPQVHYRWEVADGVVVVRPYAALVRSDHLLTRRIASFSLQNADAAAALDAFTSALQLDATIAQGRSDGRPFSVSRRSATAFDVLNAIVAAHGGMGWELRLGPRGDGGRLVFVTFDGLRVGTMWPQPLSRAAAGRASGR
jgi:hypothetical protein